jgi:biopolymer transport protein ExbB/TolQ|tara:strand:+ start:439 stop:816 length:378 start_codon:yes stop_codon:yes gene_type:complete
MPSDQSAVTIPPELKKKFPEIVALILGSESMNVEERQYWVNIIPVMTPEQLENLKQILANEKKQLAAIDAKYSKEMKKLNTGRTVQQMGKKQQEKRSSRQSKEQKVEEEEKEKEDEILKAIAELE